MKPSNLGRKMKKGDNLLYPQKKEINISKETREKAELAKMYIQGNKRFFY